MRHNAIVTLQHAVPILVCTITRSCPLRPITSRACRGPGTRMRLGGRGIPREAVFYALRHAALLHLRKKWIEQPYSHRWIAADRDRPGRAKRLLASVHVGYHAQGRRWSSSWHRTGSDYYI